MSGLFELIDREAAPTTGHRLFTVTAFDAVTMTVQRVYSSNPAAYPVGGRKPKRDTEFARRILIERQPLVCEGDDEIRRIFDDHETIIGLGLHSSINAPVAHGDRCVGVLNFLMSAERVTREQVDFATALAARPDVVAALRGLA